VFNTIIPSKLILKLNLWTCLKWWQLVAPHPLWSLTTERHKAAASVRGCTLFTRLFSHTRQQPDHQVCRWHHSYRLDKQQRRNGVQRQGQQPCTECQQDEGAHHGLKEQPRSLFPHQLRRDTGGNRQLHSFPGTTDLWWPSVGPQHGGHAQESILAPLPTTVPQEMRHKHTMA